MKLFFYSVFALLLFKSSGYSQSATIEPNYFTLPKSATIPISCLTTEKGKMIYNTTNNRIYYCTGTIYENMIKINDFGGTVTQPFEVTSLNGTAVRVIKGTLPNSSSLIITEDNTNNAGSNQALIVELNANQSDGDAILATSINSNGIRGVTSGDVLSSGIVGESLKANPTGGDTYGVHGKNYSTNDIGFGVYGSHESGGIGVEGISVKGIGTEGLSFGVGVGSIGVSGVAVESSPSGYTIGVKGQNNSLNPVGAGMEGSHAGSGYGVYGTSAKGYGVHGDVKDTNPTMDTKGVWGHNYSTNNYGSGVYGQHNGTGNGIYGKSIEGKGVYGETNSLNAVGSGVEGKHNGSGYGVYGTSAKGYGVHGDVKDVNPTMDTYGVWGFNYSGNNLGSGVHGVHNGGGKGVYGKSFAGTGVYGESLGTTANGIGVLGNSNAGTAIRATTQTGVGLDVTAVSTGIAANLYSLNNYALITSGKLKLSDIGQGVGKILTCIDAFGNAEWREPPTSSGGGSSGGFSAIGVANGSVNAQNIPAITATKVTIFTVEEFDDANQFSGNTFTASTAGLYHFDLKMNLFATTPPASSVYTIQVRRNGANVRVTTQTAPTDAIDYNTSFNLKLVANDVIEIYVNAPMAFKIYASTFSNFSGYKVY